MEECGKGYISFAHVPRANAALLQFSRKHASHRLTHTAHLPLALRVAFVLVLSFYFEHCAAHEDRARTRPARASHDSFAEEMRSSAALAHCAAAPPSPSVCCSTRWMLLAIKTSELQTPDCHGRTSVAAMVRIQSPRGGGLSRLSVDGLAFR
jgi:hypothetical protein